VIPPCTFRADELLRYELIIQWIVDDKTIMCPDAGNPTIFKDDDLIGMTDCRETMGDDERRPSDHQSLECFLNDPLGLGVEA